MTMDVVTMDVVTMDVVTTDVVTTDAVTTDAVTTDVVTTSSDRYDVRQKLEDMQKNLAPVFDFSGPANVFYGSSDGCARSVFERAISFTITKPQVCRTNARGGKGSFTRMCPSLSNVKRERRESGEDDISFDEDLTYDIVTDYQPSRTSDGSHSNGKCARVPRQSYNRARAYCKEINWR